MQVGDMVRIRRGYYKGVTARVVSMDEVQVEIEFISTLRVNLAHTEVEVIS